MIDLLHWLLVLWGLVYFITQSAIFMRVRVFIGRLGIFFATGIYCPSCTGFWIGIGLGLLGYWPWHYDYGFIESGVAAMAAGRMFGTWFDGGTFETELPMLGYELGDSDE